jgi:hypothetical protein
MSSKALGVPGPLRRSLGCLALLACLAALAPAPLAAQDEVYEGIFELGYIPPESPALKDYHQYLVESQLFDDVVAGLNQTIALPRNLTIVFGECGEVNAFFDASQTRVVMCYEWLAFMHVQFSKVYEDRAAAEAAALDATIFVFQHELGHALVHLLELPITGKEEDAVDDLATLILLHEWEGGDDSALNAAEAFYMLGEEEEAAGDAAAEGAVESLPYYDEHSLGKQRYYQIACIVYGSDPEKFADLVGNEGLPEARAVRCPGEYEQKANSWDRLLADFYYVDEPAAAEE